MSFTQWLQAHRLPVLVVSFVLALAGVYAAISLPVGLFPVIDFPRIRVNVSAGSMPARQMLIDVTEPLEVAARAVPGAIGVTSKTSRGSAQFFVDFPWGADMKQALLGVDSALAQAVPNLPPGTTYDVLQMAPDALDPFLSYALTSDTVPPAQLRAIAEHQIVPLITGIAGVRRVGVLGGQTPEVQVSVVPAALQHYGLTLADVSAALAATNALRALGRIEDNRLLFLAVGDNAYTSADAVAAVTVRSPKGALIPLSQLASVTLGAAPEWLLVKTNGKPSVNFSVFQQSQASSLTLARAVDARLAAFMRTQPAAIHLDKWYDQTQLVRSSIAALEEAIAIGLVFAAGVLLWFLRNWRVTAVAMVVVPMSVLGAVLVLWLLGLSLNIMTLGGIAAAIGLLIDDVIVMIEQIARRVARPGVVEPQAGVLAAAREFFAPMLGSSLATIVIFIPLAFLSGVTGAFFKYLSLTVAAALVISFLLTVFAVPLLARSWVDFSRWRDPGERGPGRLRRWHAAALQRLFRWPWLIAVGLLVLAVAGAIGYRHVGTGFLPQMDEGGFVLDYHAAPGASLHETNREIEQVEAILRAHPAVAAVSRRTGAGFGGDLNEAYHGDMVIRLVPASQRADIWTVMDQVGARITALVPSISFDTHQLMVDMIGDLIGRSQPVVVRLSAADPAVLPAVADKVATALAQVPGVQPASIDSGVVPAGDALDIRVDPAAAALQGLTAAEVQTQVAAYLEGSVVTHYLGTDQDVGVRLKLAAPQGRIYRDRLGTLPIRGASGALFPLDSVARVRFVSGEPELTRANLQQIVAVTAQTAGGADLGGTIARVRTLLAQPDLLPAGVAYTLGGAYQQQQEAARGMLKVFVAAIAAELILLMFLYRSALVPLLIVGTALLSTSAVFIGLWLAHVELNITAMMGMVMIIGIATEMAIFLVSEYQALRRTMDARAALLAAAQNRLRPILMSTLAMILALIPIGAAISGSGDQMLQPLAVAIIAGALVQLPLVLLALPVLIGLTVRTPRPPAEPVEPVAPAAHSPH